MKSTRRFETTLLVQQEVLERSYSTLLSSLKYTDQQFLSDLNTIQMEHDGKRKTETQNLRKSLLALAMVIQKLKTNMKDEECLKKYDLDYFKEHLLSIEDKLATFKDLLKDQLHTLTNEEEEIQEAVDAITQRIHETSRSTAPQPDVTPGASVRLSARPRVKTNLVYENMHPDVLQYQKFLQHHGGHTGGWDSADHLLFTRLLQRYRESDQLTTALLDQLPDKTPEDVAEHEGWYRQYLTFKESHRKALQEWRNEQKMVSQHRKETDIKEGMTAADAALEVDRSSSKRDPSVKAMIKKWKEKQAEKREKDIQEMQEKKQRAEDQWRKKVAYFEQKRALLVERRKEQEKAFAVLAPLANDISYLKNVEKEVEHTRVPLKEFWEQDKQFLQRRQSLVESRQRERSGRVRSRSSSGTTIRAERDPSRLLQPTAVWRARQRHSFSEDSGNTSRGSLYIGDIPHLAVPKWREGLVG